MQKLVVRGLVTLFLMPALAACGGSDDDAKQGSKGPGTQELAEGCAHTQFEGDDRCVGLPAAGEGIQLHVGPTDYTNEAEVAPFLINPGEEKVECFTLQAPNTTEFTYFNQQDRMRPGSHHMIIRVLPDDAPLGWGDCEAAKAIGGIPGSQTGVRDIPGVNLAPEDQGLGRSLRPNAKVQFELHYVNNRPTDTTPRLREAWVNLFYKDPATITQPLRTVAMIGGLAMDIAPRTQQTLSHSCQVTGNARIFDLFGHFHAHTERFSAWRNRGGQRDLIYQSFNWSEPADLVYDSVNKNPAANQSTRSDGGWTGTLDVQAGDTIEWQCDVNNTTDADLKFANQAYTAEMCILFGGYIGDAGIGMSCLRG